MRGRVATVSVGVSLTLHGVVVWRIAMQPPAAPRPVERVAIDFETWVAPAPAPAPRPPPPATRATFAAATPAHRPARASPRASLQPSTRASPGASAEPQPQSQPAPQAEPAPGAAGATGPARHPAPIDLFAPDVIARVVGPPRARSAEAEQVAGRVHAMVEESLARERAQSGNVAPYWRDIERRLVQEFHPSVGVVKQENRAFALAHQIVRAWLDGPPKTPSGPRAPLVGAVDPSIDTLPGTPPGLNFKSLPEEQALAVQARWGAPATWLRVEVEVTIDEEGHIRATRVLKPSGRRLFDRTALGAVEDAIRAGGPPMEHRAVTTRWLVEAAVAVAPPTSIGFRFDETGQLRPGAEGVRKYLAPTYPMQQSVVSHVSLVAIEPER